MRPLTQFHPKIRGTQLQKIAKFWLTFSIAFTEVNILYPKTHKFGPERFLEK